MNEDDPNDTFLLTYTSDLMIVAKAHPKYYMIGHGVEQTYKNGKGEEKKVDVLLQPLKMAHRDHSKYNPHQGAQEKARRRARLV